MHHNIITQYAGLLSTKPVMSYIAMEILLCIIVPLHSTVYPRVEQYCGTCGVARKPIRLYAVLYCTVLILYGAIP
jgi:hypothetical protein